MAERSGWIPGGVIVGLMVRLFATVNLVVAWFGYWLMSAEWPGHFKLWLCTAMGIGSLLWLVVSWRKIREDLAPTSSPRFISISTVMLVLATILLESVFMTWVIHGPM